MHSDDRYQDSNSILGKMLMSIQKEKQTSNNKQCFLTRILIQQTVISFCKEQLVSCVCISKIYLDRIQCRNLTK